MNMKIKPIYDAKYYKVKEIVSNTNFKADIQKLLDSFSDYDCSVPKSGTTMPILSTMNLVQTSSNFQNTEKQTTITKHPLLQSFP